MSYVDTVFDGADMTGATARGADMRRASFNGTNLTETDLSYTDLEGADFEGATCEGTNFEGSNATPKQLEACRSLDGAILPDGTVHEAGPPAVTFSLNAGSPSEATPARADQGSVAHGVDVLTDLEQGFEDLIRRAMPVLVVLGGVAALLLAVVGWDLASTAWRGEGEWMTFVAFVFVFLLPALIGAGALALRRYDERSRTAKLRAEAEAGYEILAARIIELYESGASTGTAGAEAISLFLEAEEEIERDPSEARKKIQRALALTEQVDRSRRLSARIGGEEDGKEARQTWSR